MVDISTTDPNSHRLHTKGSAPASDPQSSPVQGADAIVACVYYLMELSSITAHKANIDAKQLSSNAANQEKLNKQAAQLQWYSVPTQIKKITKQTFTWHTHWTWQFWKHCHNDLKWSNGIWVNNPRKSGNVYFLSQGIKYETGEKITVTLNKESVAKNMDEINVQQGKNQVIIDQRQIIAEHLATLQQSAQTGETKINMVVNDGMQSLTIRSNLLQTVESLTFTALMRRPPS